MRALALSLGVLAGIAAPLHADPCAVQIARAPDEIRAEIERWLAREASCNVALEVRVVPTEGGYYLLARDDHGRVRERVVPDGASAGVLIASWANDDELDDDHPDGDEPAPVATTTDAGSDDADDWGDDPAPPAKRPAIVARAAVARPSSAPWLRIGIVDTVNGGGGGGVRADVDVWQRGDWAIGFAAGLTYGRPMLPIELGNADAEMTDVNDYEIDALAYVARTSHATSWLYWRGALAIGVHYTAMELPGLIFGDSGAEDASALAMRPTLQASLLAGARLGDGWAFELGLLLAAVPPTTTTVDAETANAYDVELDQVVSVQLFGGLALQL